MKAKSKSKRPKKVKIKNINQIVINQELKPIDEHGYPIKKWETCFFCNEEFVLTFSFSQQNYSRKHFINFWTEKEEDIGKFTCSSCAKSLYLNPESRRRLSLKKKRHLASYIAQNII